MNSAMMPVEGSYLCKRIDKETFIKLLKDAYKKGKLESYVGYPANVKLIEEWTGISVPINRKANDFHKGELGLVMKLKYRLHDPALKKGYNPDPNDFEFFIIVYKGNSEVVDAEKFLE